MTKSIQLGRLERVDLRDCWEREDTDFTPWLACEENIALLGDAIGMELEVQCEEAAVGPFRADILCRDTAGDDLVIIENQLERTDHGHLGQTLTYAAGLDAVTVVWIAQRFTEEHRAALDWLNRITHENFRFFGIEIEVWQIGNSVAAPKFNLVSKPNDWANTIKDNIGGRLTDNQQRRVDFWTEFGVFLEKHGSPFNSPKPSRSNWVSFGVGRAGTQLVAIVNQNEAIASVHVNSRDYPGRYGQLEGQRADIETELGFSLEWERRPDMKHSHIGVRKPVDATDRDEWSVIHAWLLEKLGAIRDVFRPRIKALNDDAWDPDDENSETP
ncbi:DUF4268 domain-containing protein [Acidimicrobium ferrooxidans]|nr:DUF4268 domain-containing protein [Acidimicrobium ferrooxidans]